jgi:iron complex transport system substrate-binding protein
MITLVGATSIFTDTAKDYPTVSAEAVILRNPDVIAGPNTHGDKLTTALVAQRPGWADLKAVTTSRIYLLNGDTVSRPGPRLADALEELAKALYPELFG